MNNNDNTKSTKNALDNMKNEIANELGIDLKKENLTAKEAGTVGGNMTKELIEKAKQSM